MTVDADLATLRRRITNYASISQDHEGFAALSRVEAELSRLREQRDALDRERDAGWRTMVEQRARAEAAEARLARLQQALREIAAQRPDGTAARAVQAAREALAGPGSEQSSLTESGSAGLPDTPADSPPCDGSADCEATEHIHGCFSEVFTQRVVMPADSQPEETTT